MFKLRYEHKTLENLTFTVKEFGHYVSNEGLNPTVYSLVVRVFGIKVWSA